MRIRELCFALAAAVPALALEPVAVASFGTTEVAVLDPRMIVRVTGAQPAVVVKNFGIFEASEFATDGASYFVSVSAPVKSSDPFARVMRFNGAGKRIAEWPIGSMGASPAGIAIDSERAIVYCVDSRGGEIFQLNLRAKQPAFTTLLRIPESGIFGPLIYDAARRRLLVGDARKGRIFAVGVADSRVDILLDSGTVVEPAAMAIDANGTLYVADAAKARVWIGSLTATKLALRAFGTSDALREPVGVTLTNDGSVWVADRGARTLYQFARNGQRRRKIAL